MVKRITVAALLICLAGCAPDMTEYNAQWRARQEASAASEALREAKLKKSIDEIEQRTNVKLQEITRLITLQRECKAIPETSDTAIGAEDAVRMQARAELERKLVSPSSLKIINDIVVCRGNGRYIATGAFDASNAFGAMIRREYYAEAKMVGVDLIMTGFAISSGRGGIE